MVDCHYVYKILSSKCANLINFAKKPSEGQRNSVNVYQALRVSEVPYDRSRNHLSLESLMHVP